MTPHEDDDRLSVSFQDLKKRWAQQEATSLQLQHHDPSTSPSKPYPSKAASLHVPSLSMSDLHGAASPMAPTAHSPSKCASAPPIPPKPATTTTGTMSPRPRSPLPPSLSINTSSPPPELRHDEQSLKETNRVSLLAQQFENFKIDNLPLHEIISESPKPEDPFGNEGEEEEEEEEGVLTSDSSSSSFSSRSSDSESTSDGDQNSNEDVDDSLVQQIHMRYHGAIRTPPPPPPPPKGTSGSHSSKTPPPPPPPSKKYHSVARNITASETDIPSSTFNILSDKAIAASPPSLPPRPCIHNEDKLPSLPHSGSGSMPILPPRPDLMAPTRSHTINNGQSAASAIAISRQHEQNQMGRSQSMKKTYMSLLQMQQANGVYPDFSTASRKKPHIHHEKCIPTGHRGTIRALAISGSCVATGAHETRIWNTETGHWLYSIDPTTPDDTSDKVVSLEFAPARDPCDEGAFLWIGHKDGQIMVIDTSTGRTVSRTQSTHHQAITCMLRYKNKELWTIDEGGSLNVWDTYGMRLVDEKPVLGNAIAGLLRGRDLWLATMRTIGVFPESSGDELMRTRIPNDLGNITAMATLPYHPGKIFCAHDNGKASAWDTNVLERTETITVSMYGITAMVAVGDYYLWMGYTTGMIYVYDTRPEEWRVVKQFKAHESAITRLSVDSIGIALGNNTIQVVSADSHGYISLWDGLLPEYWHEREMEKHRDEYSKDRDMSVQICSWNIDATKPEKLPASDDLRVREWLGSMEDPDIIVVGIQEIVDLESKKQTARYLFASRKKADPLQDTYEQLTHRYSLWHDYLVQAIRDNYPACEYTVIKTEQLVGLFSCIFVKTSEVKRVSLVESTVVKTGLKLMHKSIHGNKGGIAIRFRLDDSSLCFVNCHLAAGQTHTQQRNADAEGILQTAGFHPNDADLGVFCNGGDGSMILDHEHCFLSGDLNYRINMTRERVLQLLAGDEDLDRCLRLLQKEDQLLKQRMVNPLFRLLIFNEPQIDFLPTYKYDPGTDFYDRSEKKRVPAWCDRILYRSKFAYNLFYQRHEVLASDHRPISSGFIIKIKQIDRHKQKDVAQHVDASWRVHYHKLVKESKIAYVTNYDSFDEHQARQQLEAANWDVRKVIDQASTL